MNKSFFVLRKLAQSFVRLFRYPFGIFILIGIIHPFIYFEELSGVPHKTMATNYFPDSEESGSVYYVGGENASDSNPGTTSLPFASIQKAASLAVAGDVVNIRTGTYRETIIPASSGTPGNPIVFQPDGEAIVTISGADVADGGWMVHSGGIYKKTIAMQSGYDRLALVQKPGESWFKKYDMET